MLKTQHLKHVPTNVNNDSLVKHFEQIIEVFSAAFKYSSMSNSYFIRECIRYRSTCLKLQSNILQIHH